MIIDFKGAHYPKAVIVHAVFFYVRYAVSYRDLEEILAERGVAVDHATLNRWVVKYSPLIAANAQARKRPSSVSRYSLTARGASFGSIASGSQSTFGVDCCRLASAAIILASAA